MVFQQSRVKDYNFDEWKAERSARNKTKRVRTVRKRELFYCNLKYVTKKLKQFKEQQGQKDRAKSSSEQEHKVNALASGADEGRDKLR